MFSLVYLSCDENLSKFNCQEAIIKDKIFTPNIET